MTEQKTATQEEVCRGSSVCCDGLPPLCSKSPWWFVQDQEDDKDDLILYNPYDPPFKYHCRIPELRGRLIRGCFHDWLILTNDPQNNLWSLWNPSTSDIISLPLLILKDGDYNSIEECCLSAPPEDPTSVLLLTIENKPAFVFCPITWKINKKLRYKHRWTEMSYAHQLKRITGDGSVIISLTCCDGKIYALNDDSSYCSYVIRVDIVFKGVEVIIRLSLFGARPFPFFNSCSMLIPFLKGYGTQLFYILVAFDVKTTDIRTLGGVHSFKLDMTSIKCDEMERFKGLDLTSMSWESCKEEYREDLDKSSEVWEQMLDLKDSIFFLDFSYNQLIFYKPAIALELGGYIHIRDGKVIYSYQVNDNTVSLSSTPCLVLPTSIISLWECRLDDGHGEVKCTSYSRQKEGEVVVTSVTRDVVGVNESSLLTIPSDVLKVIMEHCVGVEYMNFRATCKPCLLAAPSIKWNNETALRRLQTYSLVSPWLMVIDKIRGILTFTDPILGENYYMKNSRVSIVDGVIHCSRFGWLLFLSDNFNHLVFFNPFTNDLRKLPDVNYNIRSACFSAPPYSPDCRVVAFSRGDELTVLIHFVALETSWRIIHLGAGPYSIYFPTFYGRYIYALCNKGELIVFKDNGQEEYSWNLVESGAPRSCCTYPAKYFIMSCDQHLFLVSVSEFGDCVQVFQWNDSNGEWEKIDCLGKRMAYISDTTCLCIEPKTPEMENKIYFPQLHSKNKKIVFYSLETCSYHTLNGKNIQENFENFFGTTRYLSHPIWIEPNWS